MSKMRYKKGEGTITDDSTENEGIVLTVSTVQLHAVEL
jgi:hypothetical protein